MNLYSVMIDKKNRYVKVYLCGRYNTSHKYCSKISCFAFWICPKIKVTLRTIKVCRKRHACYTEIRKEK